MKTIIIIKLCLVLFVSCGQTSTNNTTEAKITQLEKTISVLNTTDTVFNFENSEAGEVPNVWSQYFTGKGESTKWKIVNSNGNNVLAQISNDHPNYHFNVIVFNESNAKNMELQVKLKGVTGDMDQGGGFVWSFIDADNY